MIYSKKLSKFKEIIHGFTTRDDGDFRLGNLGFLGESGKNNLVLANQVHENHIEIVKIKDKGALITKTDGLSTKKKGVILGIRTADCCPILFYEPVAKILGIVHAGWRGSLLGISGKMVGEIGEMGGKREKIICVVGPHICSKCYYIPKERQKLFETKYLKDGCLDLTAVNFDQLLKEDIRKENIEIISDCTFHQNEHFFSYRKNQKSQDYGEMLSFIGLI